MEAARAIVLLASVLSVAATAQAQSQPPADAGASQAPATPPAAAPDASAAPQTPAPGAPATAPAQTPATPAQPQGDVFSYDPEGRRDPFVSLLVRGGERSGPELRPPGREGLLISEVTLRGIVKSQSDFMAMLQGADNKTYIVHAGDKMLDGVVKLITADAVVFAQDVNDPLSLVKQREIRKTLRVTEEGK